jgi:hypothetical protein
MQWLVNLAIVVVGSAVNLKLDAGQERTFFIEAGATAGKNKELNASFGALEPRSASVDFGLSGLTGSASTQEYGSLSLTSGSFLVPASHSDLLKCDLAASAACTVGVHIQDANHDPPALIGNLLRLQSVGLVLL